MLPKGRNGRSAVLVLEDDPLIALEIEATLQDEGFDVVWVANGSQAIAQMAEQMFDCALLDVQLADGDSASVASALADGNIPFAVTTGLREKDIDNRLLREAAFLGKPFSPAVLITEVRRMTARIDGVGRPLDGDGGSYN